MRDGRGGGYQAYYDRKQRDAERFELHVRDRLLERGQKATRYSSREDQLARGDLRVDGVDWEVKHDEIFAAGSPRIFIEVEERGRDGKIYPSGLFSSAAWSYYAIGHYARLFVFGRARLGLLADYHDLVKAWPTTDPRHQGPHSGRGFLLEITEACEHSLCRYTWPAFHPRGGAAC